MENSFPKHTIKKDFQNAIFIIKNGGMSNFKRWLAKYLKCDIDAIDNVTTFMWLKNIYADCINDETGNVSTLWTYIKQEVTALDKDNVVLTIGTNALWNFLADVRVMNRTSDGSYSYIHGFTEDGIGAINFFPLDEDVTIQSTIDNIIANT